MGNLSQLVAVVDFQILYVYVLMGRTIQLAHAREVRLYQIILAQQAVAG